MKDTYEALSYELDDRLTRCLDVQLLTFCNLTCCCWKPFFAPICFAPRNYWEQGPCNGSSADSCRNYVHPQSEKDWANTTRIRWTRPTKKICKQYKEEHETEYSVNKYHKICFDLRCILTIESHHWPIGRSKTVNQIGTSPQWLPSILIQAITATLRQHDTMPVPKDLKGSSNAKRLGFKCHFVWHRTRTISTQKIKKTWTSKLWNIHWKNMVKIPENTETNES